MKNIKKKQCKPILEQKLKAIISDVKVILELARAGHHETTVKEFFEEVGVQIIDGIALKDRKLVSDALSKIAEKAGYYWP